MASTGTAAASTSITLFDFSSIRLESSMPASRMVRVNRSSWPVRAVTARIAASEPADSAVLTTVSLTGATLRPARTSACSRRASSRIRPSWARTPPDPPTAPVRVGRSSPSVSTARIRFSLEPSSSATCSPGS
jgi:hypothetical protein